MSQVIDAPFARNFLQRLHGAVNAHNAEAPTGGHLSFETAEFSHFEDGLLARHTVVLNMLDLARQIGAVPQSGTLGDRVGVWMQHVAAYWARARQG